MKKIFQYILLAVALVATASCSQELDDTLQPVENSNLQFVVSDFPAFGEDPQTRASSIGTPETGKTVWIEGDKILISLTSTKYGTQNGQLRRNNGEWELLSNLVYLEGETYQIKAIYAPCLKLDSSSGEFVLNSGWTLGQKEYLEAECTLENDVIDIDFSKAKRNYSRLRIVREGLESWEEIYVSVTNFIPAGGTETVTFSDGISSSLDCLDNFYLYGIFTEGAKIEVYDYADWEKGGLLAQYTFEKVSEPHKSYVLDARPRFSVSADKKVLFSPGNLQYVEPLNKWQFAEYQWDMLGEGNFENGALAYKIDLFGWSTDNPATPFGVSASEERSDYVGNFVDWGTNKIGDDAPGTWRTLSSDEWFYLFRGRENAESLFALSTVNDVPGLIILPDDWTTPSGLTFVASLDTKDGRVWEWDEEVSEYYKTLSDDSEFKHNTYTVEEWKQMEAAGAVFLPTAGMRYSDKDIYYKHQNGYYWSSTTIDDTHKYIISFGVVHGTASIWLKNKGYYIEDGACVRLVRDL